MVVRCAHDPNTFCCCSVESLSVDSWTVFFWLRASIAENVLLAVYIVSLPDFCCRRYSHTYRSSGRRSAVHLALAVHIKLLSEHGIISFIWAQLLLNGKVKHTHTHTRRSQTWGIETMLRAELIFFPHLSHFICIVRICRVPISVVY